MSRLTARPEAVFRKLTAAYVAAALTVALVAAVCVGALREEGAKTQRMVEEEMQMMVDLGDFQAVLQQKGMAALYILTSNPKWRLGVAQGRADFDQWMSRARQHATDPERARVLGEMEATYRRYDDARGQALSFADEGKAEEAANTLEDAQVLAGTLLVQSHDFTTLSAGHAHVRLGDSLERASTLGLWLLLLSAVAALGSLALGFAVARSLARPIYELQVKIANLSELARVEVAGSTSLEQMGDEVAAVMGHLEKTNAVLLEQRRRLIQSEKLSAMGELTAKLAHQVLNPLAGMKAAVQGLARRKEVDAAVVASTAAAIGQEVGRVEELLQRMMQYARPLAPRPQVGTLDTLLHSVAEGAAHALPAGTPSVQVVVGQGIPPMEFDPVLLGQALTNLVINAAQLNPPGRAVEVRAQLAPGNQVTVDVLDAGPGIAPDAMGQLFKPFYTTRPKGHGLGLAVSYNIVVEHGGTLSASNREDGPGARFRVTLPLVR